MTQNSVTGAIPTLFIDSRRPALIKLKIKQLLKYDAARPSIQHSAFSIQHSAIRLATQLPASRVPSVPPISGVV